jgi:hypothetical protein
VSDAGKVCVTTVLISLVMALGAYAQVPDTTWMRVYGGTGADGAEGLAKTFDGGCATAGFTTSFGAGGSDVFVVRIDAVGDTVWMRAYGGASDENSFSIVEASDMGYIIAGLTYSFGRGGADGYLIKTHADGSVDWTNTYGAPGIDFLYSARQAADGGFIAVGTTDSVVAGGGTDLYVVKTDADGDLVWARVYGGPGLDAGRDVQEVPGGGYIIAGTSDRTETDSDDVYLIRTDADGDTLWTRTYGDSAEEQGLAIEVTSDGGYVIAGSKRPRGGGPLDIYVVKTDSGGSLDWDRVYGEAVGETANDIVQTSDLGYLIAGWRGPGAQPTRDFYLIRTDADGDTLWTQTYGGGEEDIFFGIENADDGGYFIAGSTFSYGDDSQVFVLRMETDPAGVPYPGRLGRGGLLRPAASNPLRSDAILTYDVIEPARVVLEIYDIEGRLVSKLIDRTMLPGTYTAAWDASGSDGRRVASGIYFATYAAGHRRATTKLVVLR